MNEIAVSVCIRGWRRKTLPRAIASVLEQQRDDIEVIVGDDAGDLEDVVAAFGDPRLRYRRNPRRLGLSAHTRSLLSEARGRYLALLDDDDRWLPGFLDHTIARLEADPSVGIVFTRYLCVSDDGQRYAIGSLLAPGRHENFLSVLLRGLAPIPPSVALMRREVWEDGERRRPIMDDVPADNTMWMRAAEAHWAFYYVDRALALYAVHPLQASRDDQVMCERGVRLWEQYAFEDAEHEGLRRRNLAAALLDRAHSRLRRGRVREAFSDVRAARAASPRWSRLHAAVCLLGLPGLAYGFVRRYPRWRAPAQAMSRALRRPRAFWSRRG